MKRRRHAPAIARLVVAGIEEEPSRAQRKLRLTQLRCAAERADERLATRLGVLELVEAARDAHLSSLDADDGLAALCVSWQDVVAETVGLLERRPPRECRRCGARLSRSRRVCGRCRAPVPREA